MIRSSAVLCNGYGTSSVSPTCISLNALNFRIGSGSAYCLICEAKKTTDVDVMSTRILNCYTDGLRHESL